MKTRLSTAAVLAPLVLALAACGDDGDDGPDPVPAAPTVTVTETPGGSTSPDATDDTTDDTTDDGGTGGTASGAGDLDAVAQTALGAVDGTIFTIDREDGGDWEVSVVTADGTDTELGVAADGSAVTRQPTTDDDDDGDDQAERTRLLEAPVDWAAAVQAALGEVPGGTVTGVDLDEDGGTATWEVQLDEDTADETTVDVDATTGAVLRTERDD